MAAVTHFQRQLHEVKEDLLKMGGLVERAIHESVGALVNRRQSKAEEVIKGDRRIDTMQNDIEGRCLALLATQQPVAVDLRFLAAAIKITSNLERMGDHAVNLAHRAISLAERPPIEMPSALVSMSEIARSMTAGCLDAFLQENVALAENVLSRDDDLDHLVRGFLEYEIQAMTEEHRVVRRAVELILASRHLERIGDHATNVAEEVIYMVEGRVARHGAIGPDSVGPL